jgi:uncharacterized protein YjbJ (UPF0337 family)
LLTLIRVNTAVEISPGALDLNQRGLGRMAHAPPRSKAKGEIMSRERIEGATQKAVGAAKQAVGKAVGNEKLQVEGLADKVVGSAKETVGKLKDAVHKAGR